MNIKRATRAYETWLGEHLTLVSDDLASKHAKMAGALFPFLRTTSIAGLKSGYASARISPRRQWCWQLAICMSRISALGATVRDG
jgi:hypothetical protein